MILAIDKVLEIALKPVDEVIAVNGKLQDRHKLHITGEGCESYRQWHKEYETKEEYDDAKGDVAEFTRLVTNEIIDAQSRWKTAQGTTKYYNFGEKGEKVSEVFKKEILSQVWKGGSIKQFIDNFASKAIYEEFNGFYLVEKGAKIKERDGDVEYSYEVREGIKTKVGTKDDLKPYIIFKSVNEVCEFKVTGKRVEWIKLKYAPAVRNGNTIPRFRIIDDKYDYIIEVIDKTSAIVSQEQPPIEHKAGRCPVVRVSTLNKYISNDYTLTSVIDNLLGPLDVLLGSYSDHTTTARKHNFPLKYMVGMDCKYDNKRGGICNSGRIVWEYGGEHHDEQCPACKGTSSITVTPSTYIKLPATDHDGKGVDIKNIAGYVVPPVESFIEQRNEIDWLKQQIIAAGTGMKNGLVEDSINKTATEVVMNTKPLEDIIAENIEIIESVEKDLTDLLGKIYYQEKYIGCEIIYGRRIILRDENTLLKEIKESKEAGCSVMHIKTLNEELTYVRFVRSEIDLKRNLILNELEPLIGFTIDEVESNKNIKEETKYLKVNFADLIQRFESENESLESYDIEDAKDIKLTLMDYVTQEMSKNSGNESGDTLGKIPLALQQLALARERANTAGDTQLSERIGKKMDTLLEEILK